MSNKKTQWSVFRGKPIASDACSILADTFVGLGVCDLFTTRKKAKAYMQKLISGEDRNVPSWNYEVRKYNPRKENQ